MVPGRERRRTRVERGFMRLIATGGIIGIAMILGVVLVGQDVAGWIVGLAVGLTPVTLAAPLWSIAAALAAHHVAESAAMRERTSSVTQPVSGSVVPASERRVREPYVRGRAGPSERVPHRHHPFACSGRWIAAGQLPADYIIPP
jgi:hypothetical protein